VQNQVHHAELRARRAGAAGVKASEAVWARTLTTVSGMLAFFHTMTSPSYGRKSGSCRYPHVSVQNSSMSQL